MWNRLNKISPKTLSVIGFSTVKRNLLSTHLSLKNKRLDSILIIKTNLNPLRSTLRRSHYWAMLSKNTTKLGIGDENHGPLIKLQQDPPKVMQKRHLGHLPPKNTVGKIWKQHRIISILTAHHLMKKVIWNFNFVLNCIYSKKTAFVQRCKTIPSGQKMVQILKNNVSATLVWALFRRCLANGFCPLGYVRVDKKLCKVRKKRLTITVVLFIYLDLNRFLSTGIYKESRIFDEGSLLL